VNLYVLNDHARRLSSLDCVGDCGAERDDGTGRNVEPLGVVAALLTWSGVDSGILLVATDTIHKQSSDECSNTFFIFVNALNGNNMIICKTT